MEAIDYLRPDRAKIVLSLIFLGILMLSTFAVMPLEFLIEGEIYLPEEGSAAVDLIYLAALAISAYLQSVVAVWWTDKHN